MVSDTFSDLCFYNYLLPDSLLTTVIRTNKIFKTMKNMYVTGQIPKEEDFLIAVSTNRTEPGHAKHT